MARRKYIPKRFSKYEDEKVHVSATVIKIEEQNIVVNEKFKTVFYCDSSTKPEGRMCIAWGKTSIVVGSKVEIDGRFKDEVLLVWDMKITNQMKLPPEKNPYIEAIKNKLKELNKQ